MTGPNAIRATRQAPEAARTATATSAADGSVPPGLAVVDSTVWQVVLFFACWMGVGLATAVVLRRRGHEFGPNAALGAALGPVFVFLAYDMMRRRESEQPIEVSSPPTTKGPPILVVAVGALDDPGSARAVLASVGEVGPLTVAVPVEYEVAERVHRLGAEPPVTPALSDLADTLAEFHPGRMLLPGKAERSIPMGVRETEAEVVVIVGSESGSVAPGLEAEIGARILRARI